jgi:hypothetical protein
MARTGRYMPCVVGGYCIWSLATGLKCLLKQSTPIGHIIAFLVVEGIGIGLTLQPSASLYDTVRLCRTFTDRNLSTALIGLLANSKTEDRAVLTGLRNFMRTVGGASGLTSTLPSHFLVR